MAFRILLMARELNLGGSERQMTETAKFLDRGQFSPRVGCFRPAGLRGEELRAAGVPVVHFPVNSYKSPAAITEARALIRYIRDEKIDLVHSFDYPMNVFAVPLTRWFTPAIAVGSQRFHREITPRGYLNLLQVADRVAHAVVVNCEFLRRHMVEEQHVPSAKVELCHNGIDLRVFQASQASNASRPAQLQNAALTIGVVCVLRPEKGLPVLLEAFAQVRGLLPGIKLAIVGSGPELEGLRAQARALGILEDCVFAPATDEVPRWMRAFDIFVLPSLSEALSNSLMEAMACGCAVVASNVGGNPEMVQPGRTGLLFERGNALDLADKLKLLISNPLLRQELAAAGQKLIHENYSAESAAARMGEIYKRLLS